MSAEVKLSRMKKWAVRLSSLLSFLLLIVALGIWVRGQRSEYMVEFASRRWTGKLVVASSFGVTARANEVEILSSETYPILDFEITHPTKRDNSRKFGYGEREPTSSAFSDFGGGPNSSLRQFGVLRIESVEIPKTHSNFFWWGGNKYGYPVHNFRFTAVTIKWWFIVLLFSILPSLSIWRWRRNRRFPMGCCQRCGYDLRATPVTDGPLLGICPECGRDSQKPKKSR